MATGWSPNCSTRCRCHERDELGTRRRRSATPPTPRIGITRRPSDSWALGSIVHSAIVRSVGGVAPTCGWRGVGGVAPTYGDAMSDGIVPTLPELVALRAAAQRSEEHTSELQSLMRISYAVFCLKKKKTR